MGTFTEDFVLKVGADCDYDADADGFTFAAADDHLVIHWGGYDYPISLDEFQAPLDVLAWVYHLGGKNWAGMTPVRLCQFVAVVTALKGWDVHRPQDCAAPFPLNPRTTDCAQERAKLTAKLRYQVLLRDNFRCRACGGSVASGALLHIDHVIPIALGGRTTIGNLQALCSACNAGKGASLPAMTVANSP